MTGHKKTSGRASYGRNGTHLNAVRGAGARSGRSALSLPRGGHDLLFVRVGGGRRRLRGLLPGANGDGMPPSRSGSSGPPGCQGGDHHESGLTCIPLSAMTAATLRTPAPSTVIMTRATDVPLNSTLPDSGPGGWWPTDANGRSSLREGDWQSQLVAAFCSND